MWRKIRSSVILQKVFKYIDNIMKLNIALYNKAIQRKLNLDIIDFKRHSGKYRKKFKDVIYEYNASDDFLIFEGIYLNGKRNGYGTEYDEDHKLIFQGEYLNGKKWKGLEKVYSQDTGELIYEYEYSNGNINGNVKEYDKYNGELLFEGKYINGKRNGEGIEYKPVPCPIDNHEYCSHSKKNNYKLIKIFIGEYLNGERKKGKEYNYKEKLIYEGEYLNGKRHGKGKEYYYDGKLIFEGEYLNGEKKY